MADLLRVCKQFPEFRDAISVSFVERSPLLRDTQCKKLECVDVKEILNEKVKSVMEIIQKRMKPWLGTIQKWWQYKSIMV